MTDRLLMRQALIATAALALAVAAWSLGDLRVLGPQVARADPTGLTISSYALTSNTVSVSWTDSETYTSDTAYKCGLPLYSSQEGWFLGGSRLTGTLSARSGSTSGINLTGGSQQLTLELRLRESYVSANGNWACRIISGGSTTVTYTFPQRTAVTSASFDRSNGSLTVDWTGENFGYWDYALDLKGHTAFEDDTNRIGDLASGASSRSGTISGLLLSAGNTFNLWVSGTGTESEQPSEATAHYLSYSQPHEVSVSAATDCTVSDAIDVGLLDGSYHDVSGDFATGRCSVDPGDTDGIYGNPDKTEAQIYSLEISSARDIDITFIPTTPFEGTPPTGQYRIRVRSGSLTGADLGTVTGSGNLTLSNVPIGSNTTYYLEVMRFGFGGGTPFSISFSYPYIERPTPTPVPTPTPRPLPNVDFRLEPDPSTQDYAPNQTYEFQFRGAEEKFPVQVRVGNSPALAVGDSASLTCDSGDATADDEAGFAAKTEVLYVRTCAESNGRNSTLEISGGADDELLARYALYIGYSAIPTPAPAKIPMEWGQDRRGADGFGIGILVSVVCQGLGVGCDLQRIQDGIWIAGAAVALIVPLAVPRGPASTGGWAVGITLAVAVLMVGVRTSGVSPWLLALSLLALFVLAALGIFRKFGSVRL